MNCPACANAWVAMPFPSGCWNISMTGRATTRAAAQILPSGFGRALFRPDAGHRKSHRLTGHSDRTRLRRHRIGAFDLVRAVETDERRQRDRPGNPRRRTAQAPRRHRPYPFRRSAATGRDTALKVRFQQFTHLARELLTDFREVEHNFRGLDRRVRERIADIALEAGDDEIDAGALFSQVVIDKAQLAHHIRHALQDKPQITLAETLPQPPLETRLGGARRLSATRRRQLQDHGRRASRRCGRLASCGWRRTRIEPAGALAEGDFCQMTAQ